VTKLRKPKRIRQSQKYGRPIEVRDPEAGAVAIDAMTDPLRESIYKIAKEVGLGDRAAQLLYERLQTRYGPLTRKLEEVKTEQLLGLVSSNAKRLLEEIHGRELGETMVRDLAVSAGIMMDKRQLLMERPTQIVGTSDERRKLDEVARELLKEAVRRGLVVDIDPVTGDARLLEDGTGGRA